MTALAIAVGIVLIVFNGGFVALEFGLIGAKRASIDRSAERGQRSALAAQRMQSDVLTTLGAAQLGITLCSLAVGATHRARFRAARRERGTRVRRDPPTRHCMPSDSASGWEW